jgi:hypothetical protein
MKIGENGQNRGHHFKKVYPEYSFRKKNWSLTNICTWLNQGCQMVCFQTKSPNVGKFWKMFIQFMTIWNIFWRFWIFYDHFAYFVLIWYIFPVLVSCMYQKIWQPWLNIKI